ncbi:MAG: DUF3999 family protein [Candidatus Hydrogenedentes bacterium]|nr:DUF3999 family protein [Candidatus Hydrogenedentota bacterium]
MNTPRAGKNTIGSVVPSGQRLVLVLMCLAWAGLGRAAFDAAEWSWECAIPDGKGTPGFVRINVNADILDQSQATLDDLRILDEENELVPFVIRREPREKQQTAQWRNIALLNRTFQPGAFESVVLDFGEAIEKNRLKVGLSDTNYRRRALLEGSADTQDWAVVAEDFWCFDITRPEGNYKVDTFNFPANNFRYLRLTVFNMPDDPRRVSIENVQAAFWEESARGPLSEVKIQSQSRSEDEKTRESVLELDLGYRNLPIDTIRLKIEDAYFYRGFELRGRNAKTVKIERPTETGWDTTESEAPWQHVMRGVFHRSRRDEKVAENTVLEQLNAPYRYLQIRIPNEDNPPLTIGELTVLCREYPSLVFERRPDHQYRVLGGNPKALTPRFDLARSIQGVESMNLPVVAAGTPSALEQAPKLGPWTERHTYLIWTVLVVAAGALGFVVIKSLRNLPRKTGS